MKRCKAKGCTTRFDNPQPFVCWCSAACGAEIAKERLAKAKAKKAKEERKTDKAKRESLKTRSDYMKDAQREFNKYIRLRDQHQPCICCGLPLGLFSVGGAYDCGHYRSVGSAPHLRFDERNAHAQRKQCNRYGAGRAVDYRIGLIARIGLRSVEDVESDQEARKHTIEDLKQIIATYKAKAKELMK